MLPVSAEVHHVPPQQFSDRFPPFVPNVTVLPEAQALLVHAASMIANEAGYLSTQTNVRMFCYNMLSSQNWQNSVFAETVKMACDCAVLKARMGEANTPGSALNAAVTEVLALLTSNLIVHNPELCQFLSQEQVNMASGNDAVYQNLLFAIDDLYAAEAQRSRQPMGHGVTGQRGVPVGMGNSVRQPMGRGAPPPPGRAGAQQQSQSRAAPGRASGAYVGREQQQQLKNRPLSRYEAINNARSKPEPVEQTKPAAPPAQSNVLTGEIEKMNREMHTIAYFGKNYTLSTSPLRRAMEECTEKQEETVLNDGEEIEMTEAVVAEASIDELIAVVRALHAVNEKDVTVSLNQGLLVVPIISSVDISGLFSELSNARTFAQLARILSEHLDSITDRKALRAATSYITQIDRVLTKLANEFLANCLESVIEIGSFIEDAGALPEFLNKRFNSIYNKEYVNYQNDVLEHLFQHTRAVGDVTSQVTNYSKNAFWDNMVISYTVTYIDATYKELGYNVGKKPREIREATTPLLSRLINATQKNYGRVIRVSQHLLVTADDTRYRLYKKVGETDFFTIKEE